MTINIKDKMLKMMRREQDIETFEQWIYNTPELENELSPEDYMDLISMDFRSVDIWQKIKKLLEKHLTIEPSEELQIALLLMAEPATSQLEIFANQCAGDEMAIGFEKAYTLQKESLASRFSLNAIKTESLDHIDQYLTKLSHEEDESFWLDPAWLRAHPGWEEIRSLAKKALRALNIDHLKLESHRIQESDGELILQRTRFKIADQRD